LEAVGGLAGKSFMSGTPASSARMGVVFYDGECGLCNRFVLFLLKRDKQKVFRFAPLKGKMAHQWLEEEDLDGQSVVYLDGDAVWRRSDAALRAIRALGGVWTIAGLWLGVPRFIRDTAYDFIARNRRRWFGGAENCPLPTAGQRRDPRLLS
jgi:predicted DCC family thiol-disulfide oxidoreductase YuxK